MDNKTHLNQINDIACKANLYLTVQKTERIQKQSLYKLERLDFFEIVFFIFWWAGGFM